MFQRLMNYADIEPKPNVLITRDTIRKNIPRYKRHGDMIVVQEDAWEMFKCLLPLPVYADRNHPYSVDEDELAFLFCQSVKEPYCRRFVVEKNPRNDDYRTPIVDMILGEVGLVNLKENQITFEFDITKSIYSFGNLNEKIRMGQLRCSNEIIVDLFSSIGYYTLPLLIHSSASHVYACEDNQDSVKALKKNLTANKVDPQRYTIIESDIRINRPVNVAHRVILSILPSSYEWLTTAYECIDKNLGAILHCHELIECKPPISSSSEDTSMITSSSCGDESMAMSTTTETTQTTQSTCEPDELAMETKSQSDSDVESTKDKDKMIENCDDMTNNKDKDSNSGSSGSDDNNSISSNSMQQIKIDETRTVDSPPVLLDYVTEDQQAKINFSPESSSSTSNSNQSPSTKTAKLIALAAAKEDHGLREFLKVGDYEMEAYKSRARQYVDFLEVLIESRNPDLCVKLIDTHVIKSFSTYKHHVVFDVQIKPNETSIESNNSHTMD